MLFVGGHYFGIYSIDDLLKVINHTHNIGATALQIFIGSDRKTTIKYKAKFSDADFIKAKNLLKNLKLIIHTNLSVNLGNPTDTHRYSWMLDNIIFDMKFGQRLGAVGCVVHTGFQTHTKTELEAINNMAKNIEKIIKASGNLSDIPYLIIETSAGQHNRIATDISELNILYNKIKLPYRNHVKFCIDSCHIFTAGYAIDTIKGIRDYFNQWDKIIGLKNVIEIHLNDSKNPIGSHDNKHENLLEGYIFTPDTLKVFLSYINDKIIILETRQPEKYEREIKLIKKITKT